MLTTATAFLLSGPVATIDHNIQVDLISKRSYYHYYRIFSHVYLSVILLFGVGGGLIPM